MRAGTLANSSPASRAAIFKLGVFASLLVVCAVDAQAEPPVRPSPSAGTIIRLSQQHGARNWLRVTLDSTRLELRARRIDAQGLGDLTLRGHAAPLRDPIPWTMVDRIDVLRARPVRGALLGILVGGVGAVALTRSGDFFIGGALAGALGGGVLGDRMLREEELYQAPPPSAPAPARSLEPMPAPAVPDTASSAITPVDPAVADRVALEVAPRTLLRIQGQIGLRYGYVSSVDAVGLAGFRPERSLERVGSIDRIPWELISRIDKRAGSSGRGAKSLAISLGIGGGVLSALLTAAVVSLAGAEANASTMILGGLAGGAACAAVGAGIGAGVGSAVPSWHVVYERR